MWFIITEDAAARSASGIKKHCSAASRASAAGSGSGALRGASAGLSDEDEDDGGESLPGRTLHSPGPAPVLGSPSRRQSSSTSHPHSPIPLTAAGSHRALVSFVARGLVWCGSAQRWCGVTVAS